MLERPRLACVWTPAGSSALRFRFSSARGHLRRHAHIDSPDVRLTPELGQACTRPAHGHLVMSRFHIGPCEPESLTRLQVP